MLIFSHNNVAIFLVSYKISTDINIRDGEKIKMNKHKAVIF